MTKAEYLRKHVQTSHLEKYAELLKKEWTECSVKFYTRDLYQRHYLAMHDKRSDEEVFTEHGFSTHSGKVKKKTKIPQITKWEDWDNRDFKTPSGLKSHQ